jgi:hypothetical protein
VLVLYEFTLWLLGFKPSLRLWHKGMHSSPCTPYCAASVVPAGCYLGSDMNKFLANGLFGMGAAALVLTNKPSLVRKAKYQLRHSVRAHVGQDDRYTAPFAQVFCRAPIQLCMHIGSSYRCVC